MDVSMHPDSKAGRALKAVESADGGKDKKKLLKASQDYARKQIVKVFEGSSIIDSSADYPQFDKDEVTLGKVLGKGGFGTVSEVRAFAGSKKSQSSRKIGDKEDAQVALGQMESRMFIAEHCIRNGGDSRYALKVLSPEIVADPPQFLQGIMDMAVETRVLSSFEHPNIVKLRALATCDPYQPEYFIVMDRLYDTLEKRLLKWEKKEKRNSGVGKMFDRKGVKAGKLMEEKMVGAFDLSSAIEYMHENGIIYRDLKPENVGFDIRDDIKVFDFGLAKELRNKDKNSDGTYNLTAYTGSPRYMAPEVALSKPYNASCDTYSFAILLWEMMALKRPFELYTVKKMTSNVWSGDDPKRPFVQEAWPVPIKLLLKRSWSADITQRHKMSNITKILRKECVRCRGGDESGLEHQKRRSTFVFRNKK